MKKVGILSMQRIANYGSFLQAYGLKSILQELGADVQFVDYHVGDCLIKSDYESNKYKRIYYKIKETFEIKTSLLNRFKYLIYKKSFSNKYITNLEINDKYNYNPELDTLIIGSDEVFNCIQSNANVGFSPELFGKDNNASNLISYAASFGNTTYDKLESYNKTEELKEYFSNFNMISVRDTNSKNIVTKLTKKTPLKHLDPVLMYDFSNKCKLIPKNLKLSKPYIILYAYSGRFSETEAKKIEEFAKINKKEILFLGGIQPCKGKFINCSPFEVLGYFNNADYIITDTFHGTIFSIINQKPFLTIVRSSLNNSYGNQEKLTDLLETLNLNDRIIYDLNDLNKINNEINYKNVYKIIELEREKTYSYLKEYAL